MAIVDKACKKCGATDFYADGKCKPCKLLRARAYRLANKEKIKAANYEWRTKNPTYQKPQVRQGNKYYFGKVCVQHPELFGHRLSASGSCLGCSKERSKIWYAANKDRHAFLTKSWRLTHQDQAKAIKSAWLLANSEMRKAYEQSWYLKNKPQVLSQSKRYHALNISKYMELNREWRKKNPEKSAAFSKNWRQRNPALVAASTARRRSAKFRATPLWASKESIDAFYVTASALGMHTGDWYHVDHIVPLRARLVCGLHCEDNLQLLLGTDNLRKSNRHWPNMPTLNQGDNCANS